MSVSVFKSMCYFVAVVSLNLFLRVGVFVLCLRLTFFSVFVNLSLFSSTLCTYVFVFCHFFDMFFFRFSLFSNCLVSFFLCLFSDSAASFCNIFLFSLILCFLLCFWFFSQCFFCYRVSVFFRFVQFVFGVFLCFFWFLCVFCSFPLFFFLIRFLTVKVLQQIGGLSKLILWSLVI